MPRESKYPVKYPNLLAEMTRLGWLQGHLADEMGYSREAICAKMHGRAPFHEEDKARIKEIIGSDKRLDWLFEEA